MQVIIAKDIFKADIGYYCAMVSTLIFLIAFSDLHIQRGLVLDLYLWISAMCYNENGSSKTRISDSYISISIFSIIELIQRIINVMYNRKTTCCMFWVYKNIKLPWNELPPNQLYLNSFKSIEWNDFQCC